MAYEYQSFATLGVNLNRQNYGALDISQVFTSQADLNYYISKGAITEGVSTYWYNASDAENIKKVVPYPYAGQYIALVNNETREVSAYILVEKADGTFETKEVGKAPIGDNKSIEVAADGTISIKGFDDLTAAEIGYLPQVTKVVDKEADAETGAAEEFHLEIQWKPVSAVVEGDGNTVTKVTSTDGSVTVTESKDESTDTLTYDLKVTHPDIPEYAIKADERAEGATSTTYHLTKDGADVEVAIVVPDAYNDEDLATRVEELEEDLGIPAEGEQAATGLFAKVDTKANAADVYTKTEADGLLGAKANTADVYSKTDADNTFAAKATTLAGYGITDAYTKDEVNGAIAAADHLKRKIATLPEIQAAIEAGEADVDQYIYMVLTETALDQDKYDEYMVIEGKLEKVGSWEVDLSNYVTNDSLTTKLGDYYTKTEIDGKVDLLATKEALASTDAAVAKKAEADNVYTKEEVDNKLSPLATTQALTDGLALKANAADVYTKTEADGLLNGKANVGDAYTKAEADELLNGKANVGDAYTKAEADNLLKDKANTADVYTKNDVYTKDEVDALIGEPGTPAEGEEGQEGYVPAVPGTGVYQHVYSKDEVTDLIADITGGESAADVLASLNAYKTTNDAAVGALKNKLDTVEEGAEVNAIETVDPNEFIIANDADAGIDRQLQLIAVPVKKLSGIDTDDFTLDTENNKLTINKVTVGKLEGLGSEFTVEENTLKLTTVSATKLSDLNAEELAVTDGKLGIKAVPVGKITGLADNYVTKTIYTAEVGNLTALKNRVSENSTLVDEINELKDILTWQDMSV